MAHGSQRKSDGEEVLDLLLCTVKPCMDSGRDFCFDVVSPYKSMTLQAESSESMNQYAPKHDQRWPEFNFASTGGW